MIRLLKLGMFFAVVGVYMVHAALIALWTSNRWKRKNRLANLTHRYARAMLRVLAVKVYNEGRIDVSQGNYLIVSNHLSYIDVLLIAASSPSCFVTSREVRDTPFLGRLCDLAGCIFVERRSRRWLTEEINEVAEALRQGINVAIFPEATSTNGEGVKRFHRALYQAAIHAGRPVQPVCLNYLALDGEEIGPSNRDKVFWYGTMDFFPHLWNLLSCKRLEAGFSCLQTIPSEADAEILTQQSYELVRSRFKPCLTS